MTKERRQRIENVLNKRQNDLTVILENVFDPHNISAVMRSCDAVGIKEIYVLNTKIPRHKKWGPRSSSSAAKWMVIHQFEDVSDCFSIVRNKDKNIYTTFLQEGPNRYMTSTLLSHLHLFSEMNMKEVTEEVRQQADGNFMIPQVGMITSLNISVACAVTLYEAYRQKRLAGHYNQQKLSREEFQLLFHQWELNLPV